MRAGPPAPGSRLRVITARRSLRACYLDDALPYAYTNGRGELVGYDVEALHRLALELGVRLEFLMLGRSSVLRPEQILTRLADGSCDLLIGGVVITTARAGLIQFSSPYLDETLGFVMHDPDRERFESWDAIRKLGRIRLAGCMAHVRRKFYEAQEQAPKVAGWILRQSASTSDRSRR